MKKETLRVKIYSVKGNFNGELEFFADVPTHRAAEVIGYLIQEYEPVKRRRRVPTKRK